MINKKNVFFVLVTAFSFATTLASQDDQVVVSTSENKILDEFILFKVEHTESDEITFLLSTGPLKTLKATALTMPNLYSMVQNLATKLKIAMPEVLVYEGCKAINGWNAFAVSLHHNYGTIVIGQDLIKNLSPAELEAVIAHELGHVSGNHSLKKIVAGALLWHPIKFKTLLQIEDLAPSLVQSALSRHHEKQADQSAADIVKDPEDLASALEKVDSRMRPQGEEKPKGCRQKVKDLVKSFFSSHPSTKERKRHLVAQARKKAKRS